MFLRFTLRHPDEDSGRRQGILIGSYALRDEGKLSAHEAQEIMTILRWFHENLEKPECLDDADNRRALSWFKPQARPHVAKMWELKGLLEAHGLTVDVYKSRDPGVIIYEDKWQIVAKTRRGVSAPW